MIYVGIDVAKDKHDCYITNSDGEEPFNTFTISNNLEGFQNLYPKIKSISKDFSRVKVGLEATGHYNCLRQAQTDKVDAHTIALMMISDVNLKSYSDTSKN